MAQEETKVVRLKNGTEEFKPLVCGTMLTLHSLLKEQPVAFYELVMKCRDIGHSFFGNAGEHLRSAGLVDENGEIHDSTKNIVLSAIQGEGFGLYLVNPVREASSDEDL